MSVSTRKVVTYASGGLECPALTKTTTCGEQECPIDCIVSDWFTDSTCSKSCGGGVRMQARKVITPPSHNGKSCPALTQVISCNTDVCPVDCIVGPFKLASDCSKTCGTGIRTFGRAVLQYPSGTGQPCPALTQEETCNTDACIVDCVVSDWAEFGELSQCTKSCDGGFKTQFRKIITHPSEGSGKSCPELSREVPCNTQSCSSPPVDCQVSSWTLFDTADACSQACGGGLQNLMRSVLVQPLNGGRPCPTLLKQVECNTFSCECPSLKCLSGCQIILPVNSNECPRCQCADPCLNDECPADATCKAASDGSYTCISSDTTSPSDSNASFSLILLYGKI